MNKNFLSLIYFYALRILIITTCILFCAISIQPALADGAPPPDPTVGGAGPYRPQKTNVQMMAETVIIKVPDQPAVPGEGKPIHVSASFTMQNQGTDEESMQVIFPLTRLSAYSEMESDYRVNPASFKVKVAGRSMPITEISTPTEKGYTLEPAPNLNDPPLGGFLPSVRWAAFDATFPVHKNVLLEVEYDMETYPQVEFTGIEYILETGAGWYGNILSADIILRLPYRANAEAILYANPNYSLSGNEIRWHLKDIEPTRDDNIRVKVYSLPTWNRILALRENVARYPKNAEAWSRLADGYTALGIYTQRQDVREYGVNNARFADLAIQAYQKASTLRPDWGDPHFKIAKIMWAQYTSKHDIWSNDSKQQILQIEDPTISQILNELKLGWGYGVTKVDEARWLLWDINQHIPGLELKLQPIPSVAITPFPTPAATTKTPAKQLTDQKGVNMLLVPAGKFIMGSNDKHYTAENPEHQVYLDAYYMDEYEVTIASYQACVKVGACTPLEIKDWVNPIIYANYYSDPRYGNYPVAGSWDQAKAYCEWRGALTRLPTEAEWEKAARGTDGRAYPWGAREDLNDYDDEHNSIKANYGGNSGAPLPVGSFKDDKSIYGIYDLTGNLSEWVHDWYDKSYYQSAPLSNPMGPDTGESRVFRGVDWGDYISNARLAMRHGGGDKDPVGFRCARSLAVDGDLLTATPGPTATLSPTPAQTQPAPLTTNIITDDKGVPMRRIPAGRFSLSADKEAYLDMFDIDQYEVTNARYKACMDAGICSPPKQTYSYTRPSYYGNPDFDNYPVIDVDWNMAQTYCETWRGARLPVETEWQKAALGPATEKGHRFPWGDEIDQGHANYDQKFGDTILVGSYERGQSFYGVYDMTGNVWEWITSQTIKGGSWYNEQQTLRLDDKPNFFMRPTYASLLIGFRCARSIPPAPSVSTPQATAQPTATSITDSKGIAMRRIPAGEFMMGSDNGDTNEKPVHKVYLDAYDIDQYEVTEALYQACLDAKVCVRLPRYSNSPSSIELNHNDKIKYGNHPAIYIYWEMAKTYCETWRGGRLPTEAEWEKAARGTDGRTYPWGEGIDNTYANFNQPDTTPVGSYENGMSFYGLYDMAGNVWEWVNDRYDETYYQHSPSSNPLGPDQGSDHVLRGGSLFIDEFGTRSTVRGIGTDYYARANVGFRCAHSVP